MFLTQNELAETLSQIAKEIHPGHTCRGISYSEQLETDVVLIEKGDATEEIPISHFLHDLSRFFNVNILTYDVYEVGDYGEGYVFEIE